jgi:hypothetical protein
VQLERTPSGAALPHLALALAASLCAQNPPWLSEHQSESSTATKSARGSGQSFEEMRHERRTRLSQSLVALRTHASHLALAVAQPDLRRLRALSCLSILIRLPSQRPLRLWRRRYAQRHPPLPGWRCAVSTHHALDRWQRNRSASADAARAPQLTPASGAGEGGRAAQRRSFDGCTCGLDGGRAAVRRPAADDVEAAVRPTPERPRAFASPATRSRLAACRSAFPGVARAARHRSTPSTSADRPPRIAEVLLQRRPSDAEGREAAMAASRPQRAPPGCARALAPGRS